MSRPLEGLTVLEFSQFLSGPYAGLRLSDLGARVIKIERPEVGDLCRTLYISDTDLEGDSTLFHAINRNKESFSANLKDPKDLELVKKLIEKADIITQNFRPGVIEKIGLDYESVKKINPKKEVVIGFGITDKTIGKLKSADGLVVGSAICKEITRSLISRQNPVTNVGKLVRKLKNKIK